jgi:type I restriction enzyme S subunit
MELTIKQGYKQTEVGLIPEDWGLVPLDEIFTFYSTSNYSKAEMSEDDEVGCIHYGLIHAISNTQYNLNEGIKYYVTSEQASYALVRDGDVIMVDASEDLEGLNKSVEVFGIGNRKYISGLHTYLLRDTRSLLADKFRGIVLNSRSVKNQMLQLAVGMKVFGVSKTQLVNVQIPLPPTLTEQKAIATALSDVDALITSLEALITKKKAIKQGAMQELLTPPHKGGKRLPGFSGEWEYLPIELVADCLDNLRVPLNGEQRNKMSGDIPYCGANGVVDYVDDYVVDDDIILMAEDGGYFDEYKSRHIAYRMIGKCWVNNHAHILKAKKHINQAYLFYTLVHKNILDYINGGTRAKLNKSEMNKIESWFPCSQNEQKAIAQILSDMDGEITQLESKKAKYQAIKQGMMQELLTGKTRLV